MDYLHHLSTDPYLNMAFDEMCLQEPPVERPFFYLWQDSPSVIIGLNQNAFAEVNIPYLQQKGIALVRRVTGGGAVYHDLQNLNYTITGRLRDLERDFPSYMDMVAGALRSLGVPATVSGRNDILVGARKCSGYAKRVWKDRIMIHGTLMYDVDLEEMTRALSVPGSKFASAGVASVRSRVVNLREYLPDMGLGAFRAALQERLSAGGSEIPVPPAMEARAAEEADAKFRTWEWNFGHSPAAEFSARRKFACGTVQADWSVRHGLLEELSFGGDFTGNLPAETLAAALRGCRFGRGELGRAIAESGISPSDCFDNLETSEFLDLFF